MITIGQLAGYAGMTIKAVRHHHERGLLAEPPRGLGVSERVVQVERDLWILLQAVSPEQAAHWLADKRDAMRDPEFRAIYREHDEAFDWSPDDPRLPALADRVHRWLAGRATGERRRSAPDPAILQLIESSTVSSPAWERLADIARDRAAERDVSTG